MDRRIVRATRFLWFGLGGLLLFGASTVRAELCFNYVDLNNALVPLSCVQQGNLSAPCSWDPSCHLDADPSDCCTSVPASGAQTLLDMHTNWHACFGNVGVANNPPGRGQRWIAFHRQFENDFNIWRESGHLCNPTAAATAGCKIESLDWCPGMPMPYGHFGAGLAPGVHPDGCGTGANRPNGIACNECEAFPHCLFVGGGGPIACPTDPSPVCAAPGGVSYPYTSLADFKNVEEVATVLDDYFHGQMHGAVGDADTSTSGITYNHDVKNPSCSPRDPMFWRLHKALDDVARAWQNIKAVDVVVVIDRSGSMSETDSAGMTKIAAALEAADMFADLLDQVRSDGQNNRMGVISFSDDAVDGARNMPLTVADSHLRDVGGPFKTVLNNIQTAGPSGATAIGAGIQAALQLLCPPTGNCHGYVPAAGENGRKAILLLTDGVENRPPCLQSAGPSGFAFDKCFGAQFDYATLDVTQAVAVGFGDAGSLNGDLLTLFAERQGGIYMQNPPADPDGKWIDLKDFFAKAFGHLTDEFLGLDPKGTLAADEPVSEPVEYTSCGDEKATFASGWKEAVTPGDLRLIVTTPSGALVHPGDPAIEASMQSKWDFKRIRLPHNGESAGTWRAHLIRPHQTYVNGFTTDSFKDFKAGVALVRREIQRLCPTGCKTILYFEDSSVPPSTKHVHGTRPRSAYREALGAELGARLLGSVNAAADAEDFAKKLGIKWDLVVYAHQHSERPEPYDAQLAGLLCDGHQRAIITDTRVRHGAQILRCAGAAWDGTANWKRIIGDGRLVDGSIEVSRPGYPVATYGLKPVGGNVQALNDKRGGAIVAKTKRGVEHKWFVDVLVRGLSRLDPHKPKSFLKAGEDHLPTARILPSFIRSGGYDKVDARVEIERPLVGIGTLLARTRLREPRQVRGEALSPRDATLAELGKKGPAIPTQTQTFALYDDGTHGDLHAGNGYWSRQIHDLGKVDGMYTYRFTFDFTKGSCTTRRELVQSVFVDVSVDPASSPITLGPGAGRPGYARIYPVRILPRDRLGNLWGPGRPWTLVCGPTSQCGCDAKQVIDHGDGSYEFPLMVEPGIASCEIDAFGTRFGVALPSEGK